MKILLPLVILLLSSAALAQTVEQKIAKFDSPKRYTATYDKFKDVTTVRFAGAITLNPKGKILLGLGFAMNLTYKGNDPDNDTQYWITFKSSGLYGPGAPLDPQSVIFLADEKKVTLQGPVRDAFVQKGFLGSTMFTEEASYPISRGELKTLADAQKVEFQVAKFEGMLDKKSLVVLDNMLSLTK